MRRRTFLQLISAALPAAAAQPSLAFIAPSPQQFDVLVEAALEDARIEARKNMAQTLPLILKIFEEKARVAK